MTESTISSRETADENQKVAPPRKPVNIQISLCDNGWLVGVHYCDVRRAAWECESLPHPSRTYVFNTAEALSHGIKNLVEGKSPNEG